MTQTNSFATVSQSIHSYIFSNKSWYLLNATITLYILNNRRNIGFIHNPAGTARFIYVVVYVVLQVLFIV